MQEIPSEKWSVVEDIDAPLKTIHHIMMIHLINNYLGEPIPILKYMFYSKW